MDMVQPPDFRRLFLYQGKQLHLTESGRLLYQTAVTMRHDALRLRDALRQAGAGEGDTVRIGDMEFDFVE